MRENVICDIKLKLPHISKEQQEIQLRQRREELAGKLAYYVTNQTEAEIEWCSIVREDRDTADGSWCYFVDELLITGIDAVLLPGELAKDICGWLEADRLEAEVTLWISRNGATCKHIYRSHIDVDTEQMTVTDCSNEEEAAHA